MNIIKKLFRRAKNFINKTVRAFYVPKLQKSFKNNSLSVFSSNCVGCCMLHDLNVRFNSPFVNLYLNAEDYLKFLKEPKRYCEADFSELKTDLNYPVAKLDDLTVHFVHYENYEEAVEAFKKRVKRINYDNLFVIFSEMDGCTYEDLKLFDSLPYKHKVVFTHLPYENIKSSFYIEGYEKQEQLGDIIHWDKKTGRRIYDRFNFTEWLNG